MHSKLLDAHTVHLQVLLFVTKETSPRRWEEGWWVDSFVCVPSHLAFEAQSYLLHLASAFLCIILSSTVSYT